MTTDLEQLVRSSLQQRADDVDPTPQLWEQVQRKVAHRRALPLLVWTAAGVAAAVTAVAVVPGLLDDTREGLDIQPVGSPSAADGSPSEAPGGPAVAVPLSHYVAVVDGRLVLRRADGAGDDEVLWEGQESDVRTLAVRPGSTPDDLTVAFVTAAEGMFDLRVVGRHAGDWAVFLGPDTGGAVAEPTPTWSPDGRTIGVVIAGDAGADLVLADVDGIQGDADGGTQRSALSLGDVSDPSQLRLQDWAATGDDRVLSFTSLGTLYGASVERSADGWIVGSLERSDSDDVVVDIATGEDGTQYRLLAGGGVSQDAEDAQLRLEFGNEVVPLSDLATADPSGAWMTAVEGGAFVGLGAEARLVHRDREGNSPVAPLSGLSYAAWVPVGDADAGDVPKGPPPTPETDAPRADGPLSASGVTPYVAIDEWGEVVLITGEGEDREVLLASEHWSPEAAVSAIDVSVRPGSTRDDIIAVVLLATEGGPELGWFHATNGATAVLAMQGPTGLGAAVTDPRHAPAWSPDGRHLAWLEPSDDGGWTLRTLGIDADGRPTDADAGFGVDIPARGGVHVADWTWESEGADGTARGAILLAGGDTLASLPVERQGDGALAIGHPTHLAPDLQDDAPVVDAGFRDGEVVVLLAARDGYAVDQPGTGTVQLRFIDTDAGDLELDVLDQVAVVTNRRTGVAVVVDRAGGQATLEMDAATTHAFDPVR